MLIFVFVNSENENIFLMSELFSGGVCYSREELQQIMRFHEVFPLAKTTRFPLDLILSNFEKSKRFFEHKTKKSDQIHARKCKVQFVDECVALGFFERNHLFAPIKTFQYLGLYTNDMLVSIASFSKGRVLNRLPENRLSHELIQYCTIGGSHVTGGLSKLVKFYGIVTHAGDVMTYVDASLSDGTSFENAGFAHHSKSKELFFLVDKKTHVRSRGLRKNSTMIPDTEYMIKNQGNWKMVFSFIKADDNEKE
jgi:hypothetical protein